MKFPILFAAAASLFWGCGGGDSGSPEPVTDSLPKGDPHCFQINASGLDEAWQLLVNGNHFTGTGSRIFIHRGERHTLKVEGELQADGQAKVSIVANNDADATFAETQYEIWRWDNQHLFITDRTVADFKGDFKGHRINCPGDTTRRDTAIFDQVDGFYGGYAVVQRAGKMMIVNEKNQIMTTVPADYTRLGTVNEESIVFMDGSTNRYGIMDVYGKVIIPPTYNQLYAFNEGLAAFLADDGKWGFLDRNNKVVIKPQFNLLAVTSENPDRYPFNEGLAAVGISEEGQPARWGYIDTKGKMVIPMKFGFANPFKNGEAQVYDNGTWIWIDNKGKCVRDCPGK